MLPNLIERGRTNESLQKTLVASLATATLLAGNATPALAVSYERPEANTAVTQEARRGFLQLNETIGFSCGINLNVRYTYNDGNGTISGINGITMAKCPSNISKVSWTYTRMNGGDYYLIYVHFTRNGTPGSDTATLWA